MASTSASVPPAPFGETAASPYGTTFAPIPRAQGTAAVTVSAAASAPAAAALHLVTRDAAAARIREHYALIGDEASAEAAVADAAGESGTE
jgi:hypothetical protein